MTKPEPYSEWEKFHKWWGIAPFIASTPVIDIAWQAWEAAQLPAGWEERAARKIADAIYDEIDNNGEWMTTREFAIEKVLAILARMSRQYPVLGAARFGGESIQMSGNCEVCGHDLCNCGPSEPKAGPDGIRWVDGFSPEGRQIVERLEAEAAEPEPYLDNECTGDQHCKHVCEPASNPRESQREQFDKWWDSLSNEYNVASVKNTAFDAWRAAQACLERK